MVTPRVSVNVTVTITDVTDLNISTCIFSPFTIFLVPADYQCNDTASYFWALAGDNSYAVAFNDTEEFNFCYEQSGTRFSSTISDDCLAALMKRLPSSITTNASDFISQTQQARPVLCSRKFTFWLNYLQVYLK